MKCPTCKQYLGYPTTSEIRSAKIDENNPGQWPMRCNSCDTSYIQNPRRAKLLSWFAYLSLLWQVFYWLDFDKLFEAGAVWSIPMIIIWWRMPALIPLTSNQRKP